MEVSTLTFSPIVLADGLGTVSTNISGDGDPAYRVCSDANCQVVIVDWTNVEASVTAGSYVQLRTTASPFANTTSVVVLNLGAATADWLVTTGAWVEFMASRTALNDTLTHTWLGVPVGEPGIGKHVIVAVHCATNGDTTVSGGLVGNENITKVASVAEASGAGAPTAILVTDAEVTEPDADIFVMLSGAPPLRCGVGVWAAYGINPAPQAVTQYEDTNPATVSILVRPGGVVVGALTMNNSQNATATWTGMDKHYDTVMAEGTHTLMSGAKLFRSQSGDVGVTSFGSGAGTTNRTVLVSFR